MKVGMKHQLSTDLVFNSKEGFRNVADQLSFSNKGADKVSRLNQFLSNLQSISNGILTLSRLFYGG